MNRGKFISDILVIYKSFLNETSKTIGTFKFGCLPSMKRHFNFAYDTSLPNAPVFTAEDILFDYSDLLTVVITKDNYSNYINSCVKQHLITAITEEQAKQIMENNIKAMLRFEHLQVTAEQIKEILKN